MSNNSILSIVIVGAGLGGLSAAIACAIAGHSVTVLEAVAELAEIGAGLQITPNAAKILRTYGLGSSLEELGAVPTYIAVRRYSDGKILAYEDGFDINLKRKYGEPFFDIHRADLQIMLYNKAVSLGVKAIFNARVEKVITSPTPQVVSSKGDVYTADLVVGADGLWSKCRECLLNAVDKPLPTGDLAYRIVLTLEQVDDPAIKELITKPSVNFWIGPGAHSVGYSLRAGRMYNLVLLCPDDLDEGVAKQAGTVEQMKKLFENWDPQLRKLLDHVKTAGIDKWKLMHREELEAWTNEGKNFVLMGDACHPMLPYLAQGANSSIEDGAVLGRLLSYVKRKDQLRTAISLYEKLRKERGERIARETFKQRHQFHMPDGKEQQERDAIFEGWLGKELTEPFPSRWTCPEVQPWLYGYDAFNEADAAAKDLCSP
ncbi:FAD/NAD(P)-binding domain-containing protein [Atractiella rhizophila]|nr:FAD/NAD(P)-binding domain-containing protein [Atractiella rhizophila]